MDDTDADVNMKVTVVKLTENDKEEEKGEMGWATVPVSRLAASYAAPGAMPKSFPLDLNTNDGAGGTLKIKLRFSTELLAGQKETAAAGELAKKQPGQDAGALEAQEEKKEAPGEDGGDFP